MSDVLEKLQYIMDSPPHEHGGFHPGTVEIATEAHLEITTLRQRLAAAEAIDEAAEALADKYSRDIIALTARLAAVEKANRIFSKANKSLKLKCAKACAACDAMRSDYHELRVECQGVRSQLATSESLAREATGDLQEADRMIDQLRLQLKKVSER